MTELTKEQLIEEAKLKIAIAKCHLNSGMARVEGELFKIALASLEAEPVAYQYRQWDAEYDEWGEWEDCGEYAFERFVEEEKCQGAGVQTRKLYAAPPMLVVPDERAAYELFMEKHFGDSVDRRRAKNGGSEYMAWDMAIGWIIWCHRAAMFQAGNFRENKNSSTSSPATPDDWISCSERTSGKQVIELTMLVKQLVSQLKKSKSDCKLPDKAMGYLERNGLIGVEDVLRWPGLRHSQQ